MEAASRHLEFEQPRAWQLTWSDRTCQSFEHTSAWAGKAERLSFDVPRLPRFAHERLSTKAIVDTLVGHKKDRQTDPWNLFGDPQHSITDQVLKPG